MSSAKATPWEIKAFLKTFKSCWHLNEHTVLNNQGKSDHTLTKLGITAIQRMEEIMSLGSEHYDKGPEKDRDGSTGDIWFFKKKVNKRKIYIKLKIYEVRGITYGKCMSFHI